MEPSHVGRGENTEGGFVVDAQVITVDPDPAAKHRISPGFRIGDLVVVSGVASIDEDGTILGVGDFDVQAKRVFERLERILDAGGSSLAQVVKVTIFLTDMSYFPRVVELRAKHFTPPYPADTIVEVTGLVRPELMLEIEALAVCGAASVR